MGSTEAWLLRARTLIAIASVAALISVLGPAASATLDAQLSEQLGSNYTGQWFDPSTGQIKVGITAEGYEKRSNRT